MKIVKRIILWIIIGVLFLLALGSIPSFAWIPSILIAVLIAPIDKWQNFLRKYLKGFVKIIIVVALVIVMFMLFPTSDTPADDTKNNATAFGPTNTTEGNTTESNGDLIENTTNDTTTETDEDVTKDVTEDTTESSFVDTHTHLFNAATCTSPKTCSCGATEGAANGHKWKSATCTDPKTCSECGTTEGAAAGHSWKDATYTSPKKCSVCGTTEGNPAEVPGKENYHGHVYTGGSTSKKYHYEQACPGKNSHEITWEDVERRGLGPCGTCVLK